LLINHFLLFIFSLLIYNVVLQLSGTCVMRRKIPSTNALLTFLAAAKYQSFTRAADELALTESAISRQIGGLEETLGIKLFNRAKMRVTLTQAGLVYSEQIKRSLDQIERDTLEIMAHEGKGGILELAVLPTFASQWLIPRLDSFITRHPEITVNMSACTGAFMFQNTPYEAAIHYGNLNWTGTQAVHLFAEETIPVCKPGLIDMHPDSGERILSEYPLLHSASRPDDWHDWFSEAGIVDINAMRGTRLELHSMLISAACSGLGVALLPRFLVSDQLAAGTLIIPFERALRNDKAYYLVYPDGKESSKALTAFKDWLQSQAEKFQKEINPTPCNEDQENSSAMNG
jgi:LysR family transcriptional regulator, glycine cleavage system transcriptional activator